MPIHRQLRLVPVLLIAVAFAAPAFAQQPEAQPPTTPATPAAPAPAPAVKKKPRKPKPPATAATPAPDATTPDATTPAAPKPAKKKAHAPAVPPAGVAGGAKPNLLGQYGEWGAYSANPGGKKVCFAIAKPSSSESTPPGRPRNPAYMFISSRPAEKVSNEVSIIIGYAFKPNTEATAQVGSTSFALYTQQDGAWIKNASEESHLIDAMRTGQTAVVKGVSLKGTRTTDTFPLKGLGQALDRTGQECR